MTLGQRIQEYRKKLNLSQEALGETMGVSRQAISKWEGDLTIPEIDKLIALSKLFGISLGRLMGVEEPMEPQGKRTPGDRRLIRLLAGACGALTLVSVLSLCCTLYFRHQVMAVLDPPKAPMFPVTQVEYAVRPDYEERTLDLVMELTAKELKSWDTTLSATTYELYESGNVMTEVEGRKVEVQWKRGKARVTMEDMPFHKEAGEPKVVARVDYQKDGLRWTQQVLSMKPPSWGEPWETIPNQTPNVQLKENPDLLGELN